MGRPNPIGRLPCCPLLYRKLENEKSYEYWRHRESGALFAVRMELGQVTGFYGPVVADDLHEADLPLYPYDGSKDTLEWLWEHAAECFRVE